MDSARPGDFGSSVRGGDADALSRLLSSHRRWLKVLAQLHLDENLVCKVDASDIVQEASTQVLRDCSAFRGNTPREFRAWIRQIVVRQCLQAQRRFRTRKRNSHRERQLLEGCLKSSQTRRVVAVDAVSTPSECASERERARRVANALWQLPADYREVVLLYHFQGLTMSEVGQNMNRSIDSVQKLWARAVVRLRAALKDVS